MTGVFPRVRGRTPRLQNGRLQRNDLAGVLGIQGPQEGVDDARVELRPAARAQLLARRRDTDRAAVDAVGGHRLVRVGDGEQLSLERDLAVDETLRIPAAV